MQKSILKPGCYMKTTSVLRFLSIYPIQYMEVNNLQKHIGEYDVYFSTSDLKSIMTEKVYKEMECEVITHMILSEEDKKSYYQGTLNLQ